MMQSMLTSSDLSAQTPYCYRTIQSIRSFNKSESDEEMLVYVKWVGDSMPTWELLRKIPFYLENMYTHIYYKNAHTNNTTCSEIERIADAKCDNHNRIHVLVYFVGKIQPLWELLEYILANGQKNTSVLWIKQSGPETSSPAIPEVDASHPSVETRPQCTVS